MEHFVLSTPTEVLNIRTLVPAHYNLSPDDPTANFFHKRNNDRAIIDSN